MTITSKDNETIKHIKKLKEKKYRDEYKEFIIEGIKMIEEAMAENAVIKSVIICEDCKSQGAIPNDLMYEIAKLDCIYVSEKIFSTITDVTNPQGIMAIIEKPENKETEIDYQEANYLILDNIQDPGVRSTMGAIFRVKIVEAENLVKTIKDMKKHKIKIYATDLLADKSIYSVDYTKSAIVIGNEANGVSTQILNEATEKLKIPMIGKTESLNAAVATSIILYEAYRSIGKIK